MTVDRTPFGGICSRTCSNHAVLILAISEGWDRMPRPRGLATGASPIKSILLDMAWRNKVVKAPVLHLEGGSVRQAHAIIGNLHPGAFSV